MTFSEKIKTIDCKHKQKKIQFNLYRKTANILAFSSRNVDKY